MPEMWTGVAREPGPDSDTAMAQWLVVQDELLRGIAHDLSNRVTAASVSASALEAGVVGLAQVSGFRHEVDRMDTLLHRLRQLSRPVPDGAQAVVPAEALGSAITLLGHHAELHAVRCTMSVEADVEPAWAEPRALAQALLMALVHAARVAWAAARSGEALDASPGVHVHVDGDAREVRFTVAATGVAGPGDETAMAAPELEAMAWLLGRGGAARPHPEGDPAGCVVAIRSLRAALGTADRMV